MQGLEGPSFGDSEEQDERISMDLACIEGNKFEDTTTFSKR